MSLTYSLRTPYVRHARCETHYDTDTPGYTVNFHEPVLDYLDAKTEHLHPAPSHTPWTDECGQKHFRSTSTLNQHNAVKTLKVSHEIEDRTGDIISDLHYKHRAPFDEKPIYDASHVTKNVHPDNLEDQTKKRINYLNQRQFENQIKEDTMHIVERISKLELADNELPREIERQVRSIYSRVLPPVKESTPVEALDAVLERVSRNTAQLQPSTIETHAQGTSSYEPYMRLIDQRRTSKLFKQVQSSLKESKRILRKMDDRVECDFYKCSLNDKCWVCRKVMIQNPRLHYYSSQTPHHH